jgi:hypothetical protein
MAFENLKLDIPNVARIDGYFAHITQESDTLFLKTDDGTNSFSYPLDSDIQNPVQSIEYDGKYIWTLENPSGNDIIIRKWLIDQYICRLQRTYFLDGSASQKFDSNAFAITNFRRNLATSYGPGVTAFQLDDISRIEPGDTIRLGPSSHPSSAGQTEELTAIGTSGTDYVLTSTPSTLYYGGDGDPVSWAQDCYFFNKFQPSDPDSVNGTGQLYSFNINDLTTVIVNRNPTTGSHNEFRDVKAATFTKVSRTAPGYTESRDFLCYMSQSNLIFIETEESHPNFLDNVLSAAQNNQETDSTIIPVEEITIENDTIYRLQEKATFRDGDTLTTEEWDEFNYQLSTLAVLPTSIALTPDPAIISADGVSTSLVTATVRDQYDQPVQSRTVYFSDNDSGTGSGEVNPTERVTDSEGKATTDYRAGTTPKTVIITAET